MEGRWATGFNGEDRYYLNGKVVMHYLDTDSFATLPTVIINYHDGPAFIFSGKYSREEAVALYRIGANAPDRNTAYRAILAYMKMRGM